MTSKENIQMLPTHCQNTKKLVVTRDKGISYSQESSKVQDS